MSVQIKFSKSLKITKGEYFYLTHIQYLVKN